MTFHQLHRLLKKGDLDGIKAALDSGIDPNLRNENGWTLLMIAASIGNTQIGKLLMDRGAETDTRTELQRSQINWSALSLAALSGKHAFVSLLLDHGASLDASPFSGTFETYLDWVEKHGEATPPQLAKIRSVVSAARARSTL